MKLIIDTETDNAQQLRLASSFLQALSEGRHNIQNVSSPSSSPPQEYDLPTGGLSFMDAASPSSGIESHTNLSEEETGEQDKPASPKIEFF